MKSPIAISLSPNTSKQDVSLAWKLIWSSSLRNNKEVLARVAQSISSRFDGRFVVLASSGRQALYDLLRMYGIGKDDEVIIQAFTCIAVPEPILWAGARPIYVDIKEYSFDPQDVFKKITPHTKAIIVQHTFGIPGPIEEIVAIAKEKNIIVIEDCAHAFGAQLNGRPLGTFGDASIISFGRDKCLSSVYGGASIIKNREDMEALRNLASVRLQPPLAWTLQQLLHPILFSLILPLYFVFGLGKTLLVIFQKIGLLSKAVELRERIGKKPDHIAYAYPPALASLVAMQLENIDDMNARRKSIAMCYMQELQGRSVALPTISNNSDSSWLRFPILVHNQQQLLAQAREHGMLLGDWYDGVLVPNASPHALFYYEDGSCPNAEAIASKIINLPTYPNLTDTQVTEVIDFIKTYAS